MLLKNIIFSMFVFFGHTQKCLIEVPNDPLNTGLFEPWYVTTDPESAVNCTQTIKTSAVFVESTIVDLVTGELFVYYPLILDIDTVPAAPILTAPLPKLYSNIISFGSNGESIKLIPSRNNPDSLTNGRCTYGFLNEDDSAISPFGQVAFCNARHFYKNISMLILKNLIKIPNIGMTKKGDICPTTRSFQVVDADPNDNSLSTYILTKDMKVAQNYPENVKKLNVSKIISNGSDNRLLSVFISPAIGCQTFQVPDLINQTILRYSMALNDIQSNLLKFMIPEEDIALVSFNNPMTLVNGNISINKTNLYRKNVNQPLFYGTLEEAKKYDILFCNKLSEIGVPFLIKYQNELINFISPDKENANNLMNFLCDRFVATWGILDCQALTGQNCPIQVTFDDAGVVIGNNLINATNPIGPINPNIPNNPNIPINPPNKIIDFKPYYIVLISYAYFLIIFASSVFFKTVKKCHYYYKIFNYSSLVLIYFCLTFAYWWLAFLIYSFLPLLENNSRQLIFRLGQLITINLVLTVLPVTRNYTLFLKISHQEITKFHRFIAVMCFIATLIKFIVVLIYYPASFLFVPINDLTGGSPLAGTLATFGIFLISLFAIEPIRRKCYEVFYVTHKVFLLFIIIASARHYNTINYYFIPLFLFYAIDIIMRIKNTHNCEYAKINIIKNNRNEYSIINFATKKVIKVFPGCYFMICFLHVSKIEWHPFSLVSFNEKNNIYTFCAKNYSTGSWTNKLQKYVDLGLKKGEILIQGPYGYNQNQYTSNQYKYFIAVVGGIGITPLFSMIKNIKELRALKKLNNLKEIKIIWVVNNEILLNYFKKELTTYCEDIFNIEIYIVPVNKNNKNNKNSKNNKVTKMSSIENIVNIENLEIRENTLHILENTAIKNYKPSIVKILKSYTYIKDSQEILIFASGPQSLLNDVKKFCSYKKIYLMAEEY